MIGQDITTALPQLQAQARSLMVDTVRVYRVETVDGEWQQEQRTTTIYEGAAKWKIRPMDPREAESAGVHDLVQMLTLNLPIESSADVREGDRVETLVSVHDPAGSDRHAIITRDVTPTFPVQRRLLCEEA